MAKQRVVVTDDDARDFAIVLTDALVEAGIVPDCTDTNNNNEFNAQDILHEAINSFFNLPATTDEIK